LIIWQPIDRKKDYSQQQDMGRYMNRKEGYTEQRIDQQDMGQPTEQEDVFSCTAEQEQLAEKKG
jgi:hypothetical protein